jgi:hypothetical protein
LLQRIITYCLFVFFTLVLLVSCTDKNGIPSLRETFSKNDRNPFGTFVAYKEVLHLFSGDSIVTEKKDFKRVWADISDTASLYIIISRHLYLDSEERSSMLAYVSSGNSLFISSENIDQTLLDTSVHCSMINEEVYDNDVADMCYTTVKLQNDPYDAIDTMPCGYFYYPSSNKFSLSNSYNILGTNEKGEPDFIMTNYGRGRFYFHCEPRVLGNYFLLQKDNYTYWQKLLSFIPQTPQNIYWDDFYNKRNYPVEGRTISTLTYMLQFPPLAWAFWLLLFLLIVYILLGGKRRQRVINVIAPNKNTTVAFAETIGRLYLQKKDNRNIADKIINYFYEQIRNQYFLNTNHINDDFITTLSRKSNVSKEAVEKLFNQISDIQQTGKIKDQQLLSLNQQIENFNKNKI